MAITEELAEEEEVIRIIKVITEVKEVKDTQTGGWSERRGE